MCWKRRDLLRRQLDRFVGEFEIDRLIVENALAAEMAERNYALARRHYSYDVLRKLPRQCKPHRARAARRANLEWSKTQSAD